MTHTDPFMSLDHQARYEAALAEVGAIADSMWKGTLFLLTADPVRWQMASRFIDFSLHEISFDRMKGALKKQPYGSGELFCLELAHYLWNSHGKPDWSGLWDTLDDSEWDQALAAIRVMRLAWRGHF